MLSALYIQHRFYIEVIFIFDSILTDVCIFIIAAGGIYLALISKTKTKKDADYSYLAEKIYDLGRETSEPGNRVDKY